MPSADLRNPAIFTIAALAGVLVGVGLSQTWAGDIYRQWQGWLGHPVLAPIARTAQPIIAALDSFRASHGGCPKLGKTDDIAAFRARLPLAVRTLPFGNDLAIDIAGTRWFYFSSQAGDGCSLTALYVWGHDPMLVWNREGSESRWLYDPGDGSDAVPLPSNLAEPSPRSPARL